MMEQYAIRSANRTIITDKDMHPSRQALHYALNVLDSGSRELVLQDLESKYGISIYDDMSEVRREDVGYALRGFFGAGGDLLMKRFDKYLEMKEELRLTLLGFMA